MREDPVLSIPKLPSLRSLRHCPGSAALAVTGGSARLQLLGLWAGCSGGSMEDALPVCRVPCAYM